MTKKQEILTFISDFVTDTDYLITYEKLVETNQRGTKTWMTTKANAQSIIQNRFTDNLIGSMPNDEVHQVLIEAWTYVQPHIEETEDDE
jgi:hypothetical protein